MVHQLSAETRSEIRFTAYTAAFVCNAKAILLSRPDADIRMIQVRDALFYNVQ